MSDPNQSIYSPYLNLMQIVGILNIPKQIIPDCENLKNNTDGFYGTHYIPDSPFRDLVSIVNLCFMAVNFTGTPRGFQNKPFHYETDEFCLNDQHINDNGTTKPLREAMVKNLGSYGSNLTPSQVLARPLEVRGKLAIIITPENNYIIGAEVNVFNGLFNNLR